MKIIRSNAGKGLDSGGMLRMRGLGLWVIIAIFIMGLSGVASAAPSITDWSSSGGSPTNKDNSQDLMYLVQPGDEITFSVTANETCSYNWSVNKVDQGVNSNTFTFTVPSLNCSQDPSECIFEVHVKAYNENGEAHHEWVISTLNESEAPDVFEFFTDKKSQNRTETDPWGRALPEWSDYSIPPTPERGWADILTYSYLPSDTAYGTWRFKYKFPEGSRAQIADFCYITNSEEGDVCYSRVWDAHHHCTVKGFSFDYDGAGIYSDDKWHTVTIIRTKDGWFYQYEDEYFDIWTHDDSINASGGIFVRLMDGDDDVFLDSIEVYKNRYIFPKNEIVNGTYISNYYCHNYGYYPIYKNGIIIKGRNITLKEIAEEIDSPELFSYDEVNKVAACNTNLVLDEASRLIIENETLIIKDGYEFAVKYSSWLEIKNSTVTSDGIFTWNFASSSTHYGNERLWQDPHTKERGYLYDTMPLGHSCNCAVVIKNSNILNSTHFLLDSPYYVVIENSTFLLTESDIGNYTCTGSYSNVLRDERDFLKGNKSFWAYTDDINLDEFIVKDVVFEGKDEDINVTFLINAHRDKINLYDIKVRNGKLVIKESLAQTSGQSHTCYCEGSPYDWKSYLDSGIGCVNCDVDDIEITPGIFKDIDNNYVQKFAAIKYYLDVITDGNVTVKNEVDNVNFYPEGEEMSKVWAKGSKSEYDCFYHQRRIVSEKKETATGNTRFIVTDYVKKLSRDRDAVRIGWFAGPSSYARNMMVDVFDNVHGRILHKSNISLVWDNIIEEGKKYHVKVVFNNSSKELTINVKKEGEEIWNDSFTIPAEFDLNLDEVAFQVRNKGTREIYWNETSSDIRIHTKVYRGELDFRIDDLCVNGNCNDYSTNPNLSEEFENLKYYQINQVTGSFTFEFDVTIDRFDNDGPWVYVWLRGEPDEGLKIINYTYTIRAEKSGKVAEIKNLDIEGNTKVECDVDKGKCEVKNYTNVSTDAVTYLSFDEGEGDIAYDLSGNENHGVIHNASWTEGRIGKALRFEEGYVEINSSPTINSINKEITIISWVKPESTQRGTIVDRWYYDKSVEPKVNDRSYVCTVEDKKFDFGLSPAGDGSGSNWIETGKIDGEWYHVAFISDGEKMKIYVNGNLEAINDAPSTIYTSQRPIHIGAWNAKEADAQEEFSTYFTGIIDELKIYNRSLSEEEILQDYLKVTETIEGYVKEVNDEGQPTNPLENVNVTCLNANCFATTNGSGYFKIDLPPGEYTLKFSKKGYLTKLLKANTTESLTVGLKKAKRTIYIKVGGDYECDNVSDQEKINAAVESLKMIGGGKVIISGQCVVRDRINLYSNITIEGEGTEKTTIKIEDGSTKEYWAVITANGVSSSIIKNLTIDGNKGNCPVPKGIDSDVDTFHLYNSNNITVQDVKMINFWTDGVEFSHTNNSVVRDCKIIQAGHEGLRAIYSENITFTNNYVYSAGTGNAGVRIYESSNCIIENNYFNVYGFGILINPQGGVPCGNNIYMDNYIEGHYGLPGIALWPQATEISNETFLRNIIAKTDGTQLAYSHGIHLMTEGTASLKDIKIINNVINNALKSGIYVEDGADVNNIVAKNDIIVNNGEYGIYGNVLSSYNDVWGNTAGNYGGGASAGDGDISADPLFADPSGRDFHLKSGNGRWNGSAWVKDNVTSKCIDAGDPSDDYSNEPDYPNGKINLGAYGNTEEASLGTPLATGTLSGKVTDKDTGAPIEGALIEVNSHQTTTNSTGNYIITLPTGNYTVTASKSGYQSQSKSAEVFENRTTEVNFTLTVAITTTTTTSTSTTTSTTLPLTTTTTTISTTTTIIWPCDLPGDYPTCGEVTLEEVVDFINLWSLGQADLGDVVNLINAWAGGPVCELPGDYPPCGEVTLEEVVDFINLWAQGQADLGDVVNLINAWAGS